MCARRSSRPFRQQGVERERLVIAAREQAFDLIAAQVRRRDAAHDQRVEAVEGAEHAMYQLAAFRRARIGVSGRQEVRPPGRLAVHGERVMRFGRLDFADRQSRSHRAGDEAAARNQP